MRSCPHALCAVGLSQSPQLEGDVFLTTYFSLSGYFSQTLSHHWESMKTVTSSGRAGELTASFSELQRDCVGSHPTTLKTPPGWGGTVPAGIGLGAQGHEEGRCSLAFF